MLKIWIFRYDTLNLYENEDFNGKEMFFYDDATQFDFDNFGLSVILTGCSPWTLYK